jgi:F0F1-type ATP synthase assembly protein I
LNVTSGDRSGKPSGEADKSREPFISAESKQELAKSEHAAWNITSTLLAGPIAWGGIGWLIDQGLDTEVFLPVGLMLGMGLALYVIWVRYGRA